MKGSLGSLCDPNQSDFICTSESKQTGYALSVAQDLRVSVSESVNNGNNLRILRQALLLLSRDKRPELVDVDNGAPLKVARKVEAAHTDLTEVTRVVLIEVGSICRMMDAESANG